MNWFLLESTTAKGAAEASEAMNDITSPIIGLLNSALNPLIAVVVAIGAIYCVFLGAKLAKAEEPQEREKAKQHLKNAIIGFILIFVLIVALRVGVGPLTEWISTATQ